MVLHRLLIIAQRSSSYHWLQSKRWVKIPSRRLVRLVQETFPTAQHWRQATEVLLAGLPAALPCQVAIMGRGRFSRRPPNDGSSEGCLATYALRPERLDQILVGMSRMMTMNIHGALTQPLMGLFHGLSETGPQIGMQTRSIFRRAPNVEED